MAGIDSHHHFWTYDPSKYPWISDQMMVIRRDFTPDDLKPLLEKQGFEGSVAVQALQSEQETQFLLEYAEAHPWILGVVGWLDLTEEHFPQRLAYYSQNSKLKGLQARRTRRTR